MRIIAFMEIQAIIDGCKANDRASQKALYDMYSKRMMGVCMRYIKDYDDASDVLQTGFISVFKNIHQYRSDSQLQTWMRRIMVNAALNTIRNKKIEFENSHMSSIPGYGHCPTSKLQANDLMKVIDTLPKGFRTVFNLFAIEGYSHAEIGKMLDISEGTSKSQYSRARVHLQNMIGDHYR